MSAGTKASRWRRIALPLALAGMASAWLVVGTSSADTGGFEAADGNLTVESVFDWNSFSTVNWAVPATSTATLQEASKTVGGWTFKGFEDSVVSSSDTGFAGGVKQDHDCATRKPGKAPNKDDLARTYLATRTVGDDVFLALSWTRIPQNSTTASAHVGYEFNKGNTPCSTGSDQVKRIGGDMLVVYDFAGGSADPLIKLSRWMTTDWVAAQAAADIVSLCEVNNSTVAKGCWGNTKDLTALGFAEGKVWQGPSTTSDAIKPSGANNPGPVEFGEAGINLTSAGVFRPGVCEGFGRTYAVSRSSGNSTQAAMMDIVGPGGFTITNCGAVSFYKQDDLGGALQGAVFTLYPGSTTTAYSKSTTLAAVSSSGDPTLTVTDASGFPSAGNFQISVNGGAALTVNSRNNNVLTLAAGAPAGYAIGDAVVWNGTCSPSGTPDATCSLVGLPFGSYTLRETTTPTGYTPAADWTFTIAQATPTAGPHTFINNRSPITITVRKSDDASPVVPLAGATFGLFEDNPTVASGSGSSIAGFSPVVLPATPTITMLDGAVSATATSLIVDSASSHPAVPYWVRLGSGTGAEDVTVTARDGLSLTVLRGQQLTTAAAWVNDTAVSLLTGNDPLVKRCQTAAVTGSCDLTTVYPGSYVLDETVVPTGYAKPSTLPAPVVVAVGALNRTLPSETGYYEDPRLFKVITLVCKVVDSSLYRSDVTYSGTGLSVSQGAGKKSLHTGVTLPDGVSEAELCGLGGATLADVQKGTYSASTVIGANPATP